MLYFCLLECYRAPSVLSAQMRSFSVRGAWWTPSWIYRFHYRYVELYAPKQMQFEENTKSNAQIRKKKYTINFKCTNCERDMYILFLYNYPLYLQWNVNACSQHETNIVVYNLVV